MFPDRILSPREGNNKERVVGEEKGWEVERVRLVERGVSFVESGSRYTKRKK